MPIDQTSYSREVAVRVSAPNASGAWVPSNDFSYQGLSSSQAKTQNIPVYDGTTLIFGKEPNGAEVTPNPTPGPTEVTNDGSIDIVDALRIAQSYVGLITGF